MAWRSLTLSGVANKLQESVKSIEKSVDSALGIAADGRKDSSSSNSNVTSTFFAGEGWSWGDDTSATTNSTTDSQPTTATPSYNDQPADGETSTSAPADSSPQTVIARPFPRPTRSRSSSKSTPRLGATPLRSSSATGVEFAEAQTSSVAADEAAANPTPEASASKTASQVDAAEEQQDVTADSTALAAEAEAVRSPVAEADSSPSIERRELAHARTDAEGDLDQQQLVTTPPPTTTPADDSTTTSAVEQAASHGDTGYSDSVRAAELPLPSEARPVVDIGHHEHDAQSINPSPLLEPADSNPEDLGVLEQRQQGSDLLASDQPSALSTVTDSSSDMEALQAELVATRGALQQAANKARVKADELAELDAINSSLRAQLEQQQEEGKRQLQAELDALREEFTQRVGAAERKIYALTKERDMLKRDANRRSDTSTLVQEKDEIIKQIMAEGETLSKKQAAQEQLIKKLRAQVKELEGDKEKLTASLETAMARAETLDREKVQIMQTMQASIEASQAELEAARAAGQEAIARLRESLAAAEARADSAARAAMELQLKEAVERERTLARSVEELRELLARDEQQAAFREDMLRRDIELMEKRCQAAEARHEELMSRVPDATRPLLRQIEALQESTSVRAQAWEIAERSLTCRLQDAESKAGVAAERERQAQERLSQALSRVGMLRAEHAQLARSLEKERARAAEQRAECFAAQEAAAVHEGRCAQLEEELRVQTELLRQHVVEERNRRLDLEKVLEADRNAFVDQERRLRGELSAMTANMAVANNSADRRKIRRQSSASSDEGHFLQSSLSMNGSDAGDETSSPVPSSPKRQSSYYERPLGFPPGGLVERLEGLLRQREGELDSCMRRLDSLEATRNSLAEELVSVTTQCERLAKEAGKLPGLLVEMDALRKRHASALELMGEREEQAEELRADLMDVKELYRDQIDMLVSQIERISAAQATS
eukprot:jgi/Chlat1/7015/Chrsp56S06690